MVEPTNSNKNVENQNLWRNYSDLTSPEIKSSVGKLALGFIKFISYFTIIIPACIYFANKVISKKEINPIDPQIVNNCLTSANPTNSSPSLEGRVTGPPPLDAEKVTNALNSASYSAPSPMGANQSDQDDAVKPLNEDTTRIGDRTTNKTHPITVKPVDQEASTTNKLLHNHYTTIIKDLSTYPDKDKAIKQILKLKEKYFTSFGPDNSYLLDKEHQTFIAVDNENNIVGFLFGKLREDDFYVELLVVDEKFNSKKGEPSKERIGTRLMFQAMQKTKEFGKKKLFLEYYSKSPYSKYDKLYQNDYDDCERRKAFYQRFKKFEGITYDDIGGMDGNAVFIQATFGIEHFDLEKSIEKLNATALGILGTRHH